MPAWRQAPILTEKAGRERSHPHASVAEQAGTFPQVGLHPPRCGQPSVGFPCAIAGMSSSRLTTAKGPGPHSPGASSKPAPIALPVHSGLAISSNLCRGLFGKQSKAWMGFSVILFLIYISASPRSLIWKNTRRKRRPHCRSCLATPSGACALRMLWILGDRPNHSY